MKWITQTDRAGRYGYPRFIMAAAATILAAIATMGLHSANSGAITGSQPVRITLAIPDTSKNVMASDAGMYGDSDWSLHNIGEQPKMAISGGFTLRTADVAAMLPLTNTGDRAALESSKVRMFFLGIYYGVILSLMMYNIFLFLYLGDRSYLWYCLHITLVAVYFLFLNSIPSGHIVLADVLQSRAALVFLGMGMASVAPLTRSFMMTGSLMHRTDIALKSGMGAVLVLTLLCTLFDSTLLFVLFSAAGIILVLLSLGAGIRGCMGNCRPARFFILALFLFLAGYGITTMTFLGFAADIMVAHHAFQIGSALEAVLLSFALADRVRALRMEHENARRGEQRYMELAITDSLTALYNVRFFRSRLKSELALAEQLKQPLALVLMDVDDFKKYNDAWGHLEGDQVLIRLGNVIRANIRNSDSPCRYGGEEFAIILPDSTGLEADEIAGRIRGAVEAEAFSPGGNGPVTITISGGIAEHMAGQPHHLLIDRADKALYRAKTDGKNRTIISE